MPIRTIDPTSRIYEWLECHPDPVRQDKLLVWIEAVCIDPQAASNVCFEQPGTNRKVYVAHIPGAETSAVFQVFDSPVRAVHIIRFDDQMFVDRHES